MPPLLALLVLVAKAVYLILATLFGLALLLWIIGRLSSPSPHRARTTTPHPPSALPTPHYNRRSPTALTPPIDVPPRRLSFSANTPRGPRRAPAARRVTFSLTPSQESDERHRGASTRAAAPYRSPGPEVGAFVGLNDPSDRRRDSFELPADLRPSLWQAGNAVADSAVFELYPRHSRPAPPAPMPPSPPASAASKRTKPLQAPPPQAPPPPPPAPPQRAAYERPRGGERGREREALATGGGEEAWRARRRERLAGRETTARPSAFRGAGGGARAAVGAAGAAANENEPPAVAPRGVKRESPMAEGGEKSTQIRAEKMVMSRFEKRARGLEVGDVVSAGVASGEDVLASMLPEDVSPPSIIPVLESGAVAQAAVAVGKPGAAAPKRVRFSLEGDEICPAPLNDFYVASRAPLLPTQ